MPDFLVSFWHTALFIGLQVPILGFCSWPDRTIFWT
jgi:hypothetical protein